MTVTLPEVGEAAILTSGLSVTAHLDGENAYALAFDIGTTSVVCYLLDGHSGKQLAQASCLNPQTQFGGDVISRLQHVLQNNSDALQASIREALAALTVETAQAAGISPEAITVAAIAGNTAMHHLLLGIDPKPLTTPPYMPAVSQAMELPAPGILPISPAGTVRMLPNIAGFVGGDTAGCLVAVRFDRMDKLTLMLDIGTNGEMVLGDKHGFLACSSAAGPAFEGAKISCGMRGTTGAVDHVYLENGQLRYHVIGDALPVGLCGSGLLDLAAVLLETEEITGTGRMPCKEYRLGDSSVVLTQKDVPELQLAKGAIRAGIELMCEHLGRRMEEIDTVLLAGAFGNYLNPASACRIGMIPPCLEDKIRPIGNAAGVGAQLCALSRAEFDYSKALAAKAQFLELASLPQFQDRFVDALNLEEDEDD
jgi:uncharacterized 2Fe-2S/4Fe-4S cluster protein (DUF4445 family)